MIGETTPCACNGRCCSVVGPLSEEEIVMLEQATGKTRNEFTDITNAGVFTKHGEVVPEVIDGQQMDCTYCVFFNAATRLCTVYDSRPRICRDYQCRE